MFLSGTDWRRSAISLWWTATSLALLAEAGLTWQRSRSLTRAATSVPLAATPPTKSDARAKVFLNAPSLARQAWMVRERSESSRGHGERLLWECLSRQCQSRKSLCLGDREELSYRPSKPDAPAQDQLPSVLRWRVRLRGVSDFLPLALSASSPQKRSLILVMGSASSSSDDEFEVTLKIEPVAACNSPADDFRALLSPRPVDRRVFGFVETCPSAKSRDHRLVESAKPVGWDQQRFAAPAHHEFLTFPDGGPALEASWSHPTWNKAIAPAKSRCGQSSTEIARHVAPAAQFSGFDPTRRVFFMHSRQGRLDDPASYLALDCQLVAESPTVRVFAESTVRRDERLHERIAEVTRLADDALGPAIQALVGPVRDVDGDERLAVVLTTQLGRPDGAFAGVDGLTRASDFRDGVPRPFGNSADVLFLNSNLPPGEQLRAVLAHEWGHAAIFGRRYGAKDSRAASGGLPRQQPVTEDDWLNEGLAHLIEVQVSGSRSNVADRVEQFLARPAASPLIVRDYSRTEYWRHHGCRGATYLFLDWCRRQSGPDFLDRLIDGEEVGVENLQAATGRSWEDLFRDWTVSLGRSLASEDSLDNEVSHGKPQPRDWHPVEEGSREITVRLRGTTAAFVRLTLDGSAENWRLVADASPECQLQLTAIAAE